MARSLLIAVLNMIKLNQTGNFWWGVFKLFIIILKNNSREAKKI